MDPHPIQQPIRSVQVDAVAGAGPDGDGNVYFVGDGGVTRIEACAKPGLHCDIPYIRVWADDRCLAEFCQHNIVGVYFASASSPEAEPVAETWPIELTAEEAVTAAKWKACDVHNYVRGYCTTCSRIAAECDCIPF